MATGLPSWSDVWGIVTKQQAVDPDLMPKMAAYLDVYGYKLHGRAVEQVCVRDRDFGWRAVRLGLWGGFRRLLLRLLNCRPFSA